MVVSEMRSVRSSALVSRVVRLNLVLSLLYWDVTAILILIYSLDEYFTLVVAPSQRMLAVKHEVMGFFSSRRPEQVEEPLNNDITVVQVIRSRFVSPSVPLPFVPSR